MCASMPCGGKALRVALVQLVVVLFAFPLSAEAMRLRECKDQCAPTISDACDGLKKGKFRKCRNRIWKQCKKERITCATTTTTTSPLPTTTTLRRRPPRATTTTTTLPRFGSTTTTQPDQATTT